MTWADVFTLLGTIGGIGGVVVMTAKTIASSTAKTISDKIVASHKAALDQQLETHKSALMKDADSHRLLLRRQELMFEREYAAAEAYFQFFGSILPEPWAPDLDWYDAQEIIAENFSEHADSLKKILNSYNAALSDNARKLLTKAKYIANDGIFETGYSRSAPDYEISGLDQKDREIVDTFWETLKEIDKQLRNDIKFGSFQMEANQPKY